MAQQGNNTFDRLERFYDAVPRGSAVAEDIGGLVLFVREGEGWPYYARPRLAADAAPSAADVTAVRRRQRELGVPEAFEWVHENNPDLLAMARSAGLSVLLAPLMVLENAAVLPDLPVPGARVRLLDPASPTFDEDEQARRAVAMLGFAAPPAGASTADALVAGDLAFGGVMSGGPISSIPVSGDPTADALGAGGRLTADHPTPGVGPVPLNDLPAIGTPPAGPAERDAFPPPSVEELVDARRKAEAGLRVSAIVDSPTEGVLAGGILQRVGSVAEIAGVATLPSARRRGFASQLTAALARHALSNGVDLVFLSAADDDTARLYSRVGFRRLGTACIATP